MNRKIKLDLYFSTLIQKIYFYFIFFHSIQPTLEIMFDEIKVIFHPKFTHLLRINVDVLIDDK